MPLTGYRMPISTKKSIQLLELDECIFLKFCLNQNILYVDIVFSIVYSMNSMVGYG